jgi:hypothetical protein
MAYDSSIVTARLGQLAASAGGAFACDDDSTDDVHSVREPAHNQGPMLWGIFAALTLVLVVLI